jgi:hypothetical protein
VQLGLEDPWVKLAELATLEQLVKPETLATREQPEERVKLAEPAKRDPREVKVHKVCQV